MRLQDDAPTVTLVQPTCVSKLEQLQLMPKTSGNTYSIDDSTYTNTDGIFSEVAAGTYNVTVKNSVGVFLLKLQSL
jgi:hypothetical protein